jgi:hypothetical protein
MIQALLIVGPFVGGFVIGRWWAPLAAVPIGVWIASVTGVDEVPHWYLGVAWAVIFGGAIAAGVAFRRYLRIRVFGGNSGPPPDVGPQMVG